MRCSSEPIQCADVVPFLSVWIVEAADCSASRRVAVPAAPRRQCAYSITWAAISRGFCYRTDWTAHGLASIRHLPYCFPADKLQAAFVCSFFAFLVFSLSIKCCRGTGFCGKIYRFALQIFQLICGINNKLSVCFKLIKLYILNSKF